MQRNLTDSEMRRVVRALTMAQAVTWDYAPARMDLIRQWEQRGTKKGDAAIAAHLESAAIRYLVSENRDFLKELPTLPFTVLSSEEAVWLLGESGRGRRSALWHNSVGIPSTHVLTYLPSPQVLIQPNGFRVR